MITQSKYPTYQPQSPLPPPSPKPPLPQPKQNQAKFQWSPCYFILRQKYKNEFMYRSLKPTMEIISSTTDQQRNKVKLKIEMDRTFEYKEEAGWTWHKSWIIPPVRVSVEFPYYSKSGKVLPENCSFIMRVVKASSKNFEKLFMIDVGVMGNNVKSAENGVAVFQGLKFSETSYKNDGTKFMLVVILRMIQPGHVHPDIIDCVISSPILIDSRRTATNRIGQSISLKNVLYNLFNFNPLKLEEVLVKRVKEVSEVEIGNSAEGLYNYLTAPNIRNKIKSPFFLYLRFSKVLKMWYNTNHLNRSDIINSYMKKMKNLFMEDKLKSKKQRKNNEITQNTLIIFQLQSSKELRNQIYQKLESNYGSLSLVSPSFKPPQQFKLISVEDIKSQSQEFYSRTQPHESERQDTETSQIKEEYLMIRPLPYMPFAPEHQVGENVEGSGGNHNDQMVKYKLFNKLLFGGVRPVEIVATCADNQTENGTKVKVQKGSNSYSDSASNKS